MLSLFHTTSRLQIMHASAELTIVFSIYVFCCSKYLFRLRERAIFEFENDNKEWGDLTWECWR